MNRTVAALASGTAAACEVAAVVVLSGEERWHELAVAPMLLAYAAVGLVIVWHHPLHTVGRLAVGVALVMGVGELLVAASYSALHDHPNDSSWAVASILGSAARLVAWLVAILWLPLRFPDGRPEHPGRLLRVAEVTAAGAMVSAVVMTVFEAHLDDVRLDQIDNPLAGSALASVGDVAGISTILLAVAGIVLAVACLVRRYRHGGPLTSQQIAVFGLAFLPPIAALVANFWVGQQWLVGLSTAPIPLAIGVAVLQRRLYDLPLVINKSLAYGSLWLAIAALYALVVGAVASLVNQPGADWLPWLAAAVVAVSFAPLREVMQRAANRATYGQWSRPTEVLARTSRRLADADDQRALLTSLAQELALDLGLGRVEISDSHGRVLAVGGEGDGLTEDLALMAYGVEVGTLRWCQRTLRESDQRLLADIATQLGSVVHARGLLASVRRAQERLVLGREEERRRLRRDLHDGLGPTLAGLSLRVDTLRNELDDPAAEARLLSLRGAIQDAVEDVRRLVEGLRPASLDDLGLVEAVGQTARRLAGQRPKIEVDFEALPRLPAAVEVAAYRIAQEALTNAVRHSRAQRITVRLAHDDEALAVAVSDDGSGTLRPRAEGVGLSSMRERAEEIGGSFTVTAVPGRGTTILARLPFEIEETP